VLDNQSRRRAQEFAWHTGAAATRR
jgi:hypothetical protein